MASECPGCGVDVPSDAVECESCGTLLDRKDQPGAVVYNARNLADALLVRGILEADGIPCAIPDEGLEDMEAMIPSRRKGLDVMVPNRFRRKAQAVLCASNVECSIDPGEVADILERLASDAARMDPAPLGEDLSRRSRDFRRDVFRRIRARGEQGTELLVGLLSWALRHAPDPEADDVEDEGTWLSQNPLVHELPAVAAETGDVELVEALRAEAWSASEEDDGKVRLRAARALGRLNDRLAAERLVELLEDAESSVRDEAIEALYVLSNGRDKGFDPDAEPDERREAVERWRAWLAELV